MLVQLWILRQDLLGAGRIVSISDVSGNQTEQQR